MATKREVIRVPRGVVKKICQSQNVGQTTVYAALNFNSDSVDAQKIRHLALEIYGGVKTVKVFFNDK